MNGAAIMITAINAAATSERELTEDELSANTLSLA
jgi:hypothetical protein